MKRITDSGNLITRRPKVSKITGTVCLSLFLWMNGTSAEASGKNGSATNLEQSKTSVMDVSQNLSKVSGKVTDETGAPLIGVSVVIKGSTTGTVTDIDGNYSLQVPANSVLLFSYVGYVSQEVSVGNKSDISVSLKEDVKVIDEFIVIGYGKVKKRDLTGAVSSVKASDMELTAVASVAHALQGKAAGLSVTQNSAQPGGGLHIRIRGDGSPGSTDTNPLYIVDGIPISTPPQPGSGNERLDAGTQSILNFLNPNDIESVEVLKDASSTAIYGSRAANGVVLITTKKGAEGKPRINFSASYGVQKYTDMYDTFGLKEWMDMKNSSTWDYWLWENQVTPYGNRTLSQAIAAPKNGVKYRIPYTDAQIENAGEGTDWLDLVTRDGSIEQYNVSMQGGNGGTRYMASLGYFDQQGIIRNSGLQRYSGKFTFDQDISKYFKTGINIIASRIQSDNSPLGGEEYEKSGLIRSAVQMGPHIPAVLEDGTYPINPLLPTQPNPYSLLEVTDKGQMDRIIANAYITAEPIKDLLLKVSVGFDRGNQSRKTYMPKSTLYGNLTNGIGTINESDDNRYLTELTATYSFELNKIHKFTALAGYSFEKIVAEGSNLGNNGFITDGFLYNNMNAGEGTKVVGSYSSEDKIASFFGRINYVLMDRYLVTATFRRDGASYFAKNHKWGNFPSIAIGWNMVEEPFMEPVKNTIEMLKWRISYGQTGNPNIAENAYAAYTAGPAWNNQDNSLLAGVFPTRLANDNLKWETTSELNIGLDLALLHGKISTSFEYYNREISDLINYKQLNAYHDITRVIANLGKTKSHGFELTVNTKNITRKDFSWTTDFTFATAKDYWKERTPDWKPSVYEKEDDPIRAIYSRYAIGIMQAGEAPPAAQPDLKPGQLIIADIDGYVRDENGDPVTDANGRFLLTGKPDDIIDDADTRLLGTTDPGFTLGLTNQMRYKGFDFSFNLYGLFDRTMVDPTRDAYGITTNGIAQYGYNALKSVKKAWTPENPSTEHPSSFYGWSSYSSGDWFRENAWFIRLQNATLGYTLPKTQALNKIFSNVRFYFNVNNVFVITPYDGLDPETDAYAASYPNARTFTLGVDIRF